MRTLLVFVFTLGLFTAVHAAEAPGRVVKVLPLFLDRQGHDATTPSLFERDAYQAYLREHTNEVSAVRFDVQWRAAKTTGSQLKICVELRGIGANGKPELKTIETEIAPRIYHHWTNLTFGGDEYKQFGRIVAWRVTLWNGGRMIGEQKSFLW